MKNRNYIILRMLQKPSITYSQIGKRFGITRERVRQIRQEFIKRGISVPNRYKDRTDVIEALKNARLSNKQISKTFKLTEPQLEHIRSAAKNKGHKFPCRWPKPTVMLKIIELFNNDNGPKHGRCLKISKKLGLSQQNVINRVGQARRKGLLKEDRNEQGQTM